MRPIARIRDFLNAENTLPFIPYGQVTRMLKEKERREDILALEEYAGYPDLDEDVLESRLAQEHERAGRLDDKTVRLSFALTFGLAVLGVVGGVAIEGELQATQAMSVALLFLGSVVGFYMAAAALLVAGSLQGEPWYGFGTYFAIELGRRGPGGRRRYYAEALARQELVNIRGYNRNTVTYLCLRNAIGALVILGGFVLAAFVRQQFLC